MNIAGTIYITKAQKNTESKVSWPNGEPVVYNSGAIEVFHTRKTINAGQ